MRHKATDHLGFEIAISLSQQVNCQATYQWGSSNGAQQRGGFNTWNEAFEDACKTLGVNAKPKDYTND